MGVVGIVLSVLGMIFSVGFAFLGALCTENMLAERLGDGETNLPILSLIGAIAFFGLAFFAVILILNGIAHAVYQKKLNGRGVGTAALVVSCSAFSLRQV